MVRNAKKMRLTATNSDDLLLIKVADFLSAQWAHFPSDVPLVSTMLVMALKRFPFIEHECFPLEMSFNCSPSLDTLKVKNAVEKLKARTRPAK